MQLFLCFLFVLASTVSANFQFGEIVPSSRRGQYHGVAIPIPQPKGLKAIYQNYKIQFVFDGDRVYTPWIQIIGKKMIGAPIVHIELEQAAETLASAKAQVVPINSEYLREHESILREFQNATLWPKHLLVHYTWKHTNPVNVNGGLYFIFLIGIVVSAVLGLSVIISYEDKLQAFLADLNAEEGETSAKPPGNGVIWEKAD